MPNPNSDARFYVSNAPVIEIEDGMFTITYSAGDWRFNVAMPPRVFLKALGAANAIAGEFEDGARDTVVAFGRVRATDAGH